MDKIVKTTPFDAAQFMTESEDVIDFLNDALESGHAPYIAAVLGDVARSKGMTKIAAQTGVNRQALYTALSSSGNPTPDTLLKVMAALGMRLKCVPVEEDQAEAVGRAA